MYFDLWMMTVAIENRLGALGTCRLANSLFSVFSLKTSEQLVRLEWERHQSMLFRPREDDGTY